MSLNHFLFLAVLNFIGLIYAASISKAWLPQNSDIWSSSHQLMRVPGGTCSNDPFMGHLWGTPESGRLLKQPWENHLFDGNALKMNVVTSSIGSK